MAENNDLFQFDETEEQFMTISEPVAESEAQDADNTTGTDSASLPEDDHLADSQSDPGSYDDDSIQHLSWNEHIRRRPGMYIGKLGDGSHAEDGIYVLVKEVVDNSIDEFNMGAGKRIDISLSQEGVVEIRDYGRGIPLGKVKEVASEINTGGKFDDKN